jgi:hypothetical protein
MSKSLVTLTTKRRKRISWFVLPVSPSAAKHAYVPVPASEHRRFYLRRNYRVVLSGHGGRRYDCFLQRYGRRKTRVQIDKVDDVFKDLAVVNGDAVLLGVLDKASAVYAVRRLSGDRRIEWRAPEVKCISWEELRYGYVALDSVKKPKGRGNKWVLNALLIGKTGRKEKTQLILERMGIDKRVVYYLSGLRDWFLQERAMPNDVLCAQLSRDRTKLSVHIVEGATELGGRIAEVGNRGGKDE